jgi:hypothetical protein
MGVRHKKTPPRWMVFQYDAGIKLVAALGL